MATPETAADRLLRIAEVAAAKLRRLSEAEVSPRPAPDKWSRKEILGHLLDSAGNNLQRIVRAQEQNEGQELVFPTYQGDSWVRLQDYQSRAWPELVALWR